jgi:FkbM family methyltransferase
MLKKIIKYFLKRVGLVVVKTPKNNYYFRNEAMFAGLKRFKSEGFPVNSIIDVGAAEGSWSLTSNELFSDANFLLFEPLIEREKGLKMLCCNKPNFKFVPKAAGNLSSTIKFKVTEDLDGSGIANKEDIKAGNFREVEVVRLVQEIKKHQLKGPYIIKLDTHGFEVPIIEGCENIIGEVNLFIIECYGFYLTKDSLLFGQMCDYMLTKGFRLYDIVDIMRRSKDNAFWQCDAFFIPSDNVIFSDNNYN